MTAAPSQTRSGASTVATPPQGLCAVFLGIDGSGKSTLLQRLEDEPPTWCSGVTVRHLSPLTLKRRSSAGIDTSEPHGTPARGILTSLLKTALWAYEYAWGFRSKVAPKVADGHLVLFDRYLVDALVDPARYRYGAPRWLLRALWRVVPKPDVIVFLDAPIETLRARKQEVEPETMARLRAAYLAEAARDPRWRVVDVSGDVEQALANLQPVLLAAAGLRELSKG